MESKISKWTIGVLFVLIAFSWSGAAVKGMYPEAPPWQAGFNTEVASAVKVDTTNKGRGLRFSFDLAWQPTYTSIVCWGKEGDQRLRQPSWTQFREEMNKRKSETIGLSMKPWGDGETAALLTVHLATPGTSQAQDDARETIDLLRSYSPCVR